MVAEQSPLSGQCRFGAARLWTRQTTADQFEMRLRGQARGLGGAQTKSDGGRLRGVGACQQRVGGVDTDAQLADCSDDQRFMASTCPRR